MHEAVGKAVGTGDHHRVGMGAKMRVGRVDLVAGGGTKHDAVVPKRITVDALEQPGGRRIAACRRAGEGAAPIEAHERDRHPRQAEFAASAGAQMPARLVGDGKRLFGDRPVPCAAGLQRRPAQFHQIVLERDLAGEAVAAEIGDAAARRREAPQRVLDLHRHVFGMAARHDCGVAFEARKSPLVQRMIGRQIESDAVGMAETQEVQVDRKIVRVAAQRVVVVGAKRRLRLTIGADRHAAGIAVIVVERTKIVIDRELLPPVSAFPLIEMLGQELVGIGEVGGGRYQEQEPIARHARHDEEDDLLHAAFMLDLEGIDAGSGIVRQIGAEARGPVERPQIVVMAMDRVVVGRHQPGIEARSVPARRGHAEGGQVDRFELQRRGAGRYHRRVGQPCRKRPGCHAG